MKRKLLGAFGSLVVTCSNSAETLFTEIPISESGLTTHHRWTFPEEWTAINSYAAMAGVAMGDYDGDGLLDLFLGSQTDGGVLYRNLGGLRFEDVTETAGLQMKGRWTTGCTFVDVNQDGHLDLFLGAYRQKNELYLGQGDGTFREMAETMGLAYAGSTVQASFADYDRDGDLDCFLLTNKFPATPNAKVEARVENGKIVLPESAREFKNVVYDKDGRHHIIDSGQHDYLFENDGKGKFVDVTKEMGLAGHTAPGLSAVWWDANNDHWPDLYVANDFYLPDHLWLNEKGKRFNDLHKASFPHQPWFSMGSDVCDLNGDGHFDYLTTDMSSSTHFRSKLTMGDMSADSWFLDSADPPQYMRNSVYLNGGNLRFMEVAQALGLSSTNWTWGVRAADLDLDGDEDLLFTTGMTRDFENSDLNEALQKALSGFDQKTNYEGYTQTGFRFWENLPELKQDNFAFENQGELKFKNVTKDWGLAKLTVSNGLAIGDLDNDGDPEVVMANFNAPPLLYRNNAKSPKLKVRLRGQVLGARVILTRANGSESHRVVSNTRGFLSSSPPEEIFAFSPDASLRVIWPLGEETIVDNLEQGTLTLDSKNAKASLSPILPSRKPLLSESELLRPVRHTENTDYDEFLAEPLLPHRVSQLGPGLAFADLNGDGNEDFLLTGAAGTPSMLGFITEKGRALAQVKASQEVLNNEKTSEHLAPLFFDADRDGDLDVLLTSGGTESKNGSPALSDFLFLNNGKGGLSAAPEGALPELMFSAGAVTAGDIDRDGDLDLFIAGRVNPEAYPTSPRSALLRNDSKPGQPKFVDITEQAAPSLMEAGMVTSALFSEATGDDLTDLLLTLEWGSVLLLENAGEMTFKKPRSLTESGWYTSISPGDIDNDGDTDYLVGNFGHNTKYHPGEDSPVRIYYGRFGDSPKPQIVEAAVKKGSLLPVRGKSCSQNAMPFIVKKFPTYQSFASQTLGEIYSATQLKASLTLEAKTLATSILINQGSGTFEVSELPFEAQFSPTFGSALIDLNGDGYLDAALAQNFFGPQRETGRYDGGMGLILAGDGTGKFKPMWPDTSGFVVPEDATALCVTDINLDQKPDLVVATNNGSPRTFLNQAQKEFYKVTLKGPPGNPTAIGARVFCQIESGRRLSFQVHCGGGYLSQSTASFFLPPLSGGDEIVLEVKWPDGLISEYQCSGVGPFELKYKE